MTTDKELLELAAKAAGIDIVPCTCSDARWPFKHHEVKSGKYGHWNPIVDDGDALRLAVKLHLSVEIWAGSSRHKQGVTIAEHDNASAEFPHNSDPYAATRRAIVLAAAEIGKAMP